MRTNHAKIPRQRLPKGTLRLKGSIWHLQWKHNGLPYSTTLNTRSEREAKEKAKKEIAGIQSSIIDHTFNTTYGHGNDKPVTLNGSTPLASAWTHYLASQIRPDTGSDTLGIYCYQFQSWVQWMNKYPQVQTISQVTKEIAREFASDFGNRSAPSTFNKYINLLHLDFRVLLDDPLFPNPWDNIQRKKQNPNHKRPFTPHEAKTIFNTAEHEILTLCIIGYWTGLRLGDCCRLDWSEVDMDAKMITKKISSEPVSFVKEKTGNSARHTAQDKPDPSSVHVYHHCVFSPPLLRPCCLGRATSFLLQTRPLCS